VSGAGTYYDTTPGIRQQPAMHGIQTKAEPLHLIRHQRFDETSDSGMCSDMDQAPKIWIRQLSSCHFGCRGCQL
jgi:hypothetical protein